MPPLLTLFQITQVFVSIQTTITLQLPQFIDIISKGFATVCKQLVWHWTSEILLLIYTSSSGAEIAY
jgi:hypothetical protein